MKLMSEWLDGMIDSLSGQQSRSSVLLVVLVVLVIGAGSLYMLINSPS